MRRIVVPVGLLLLAFLGMTSAIAEEPPRTPEALIKAYEAHVNAGDATALASLYAPDARAFDDGTDKTGREDVRMYFQMIFGGLAEQELDYKAEITIEESWIDGDTAMVWGDFGSTAEGNVIFAARIVLRLIRDGASWKISHAWSTQKESE